MFRSLFLLLVSPSFARAFSLYLLCTVCSICCILHYLRVNFRHWCKNASANPCVTEVYFKVGWIGEEMGIRELFRQLFSRLSSTSVKYLYTSRLISSIFDSRPVSLCHTFVRVLHTHRGGGGERFGKSSAVLVKFCAVSNMLMVATGLRNR